MPETTLATTVIAGSGKPTRTLLVLHGVYGRGRNWAAVARRVADRRPDWALRLVDLRLHGSSPAMAPPHTIRAAAGDLVQLAEAERLVVDGVLGHSLGGKVALALAEAWHERPLQVWLVDSTPEAREPAGEAWEMLARVRALPAVFTSRDEAVAELQAAGCSEGVSRWMATNLERQNDTLVWSLDFDAIESLLRDFFATDMWAALESLGDRYDIHVAKAAGSSVLSADAVQRISTLAAAGNHIHLHHVDGGHWVNTENPAAMIDLLVAELPRRDKAGG